MDEQDDITDDCLQGSLYVGCMHYAECNCVCSLYTVLRAILHAVFMHYAVSMLCSRTAAMP
jgi:hypothetical protein